MNSKKLIIIFLSIVLVALTVIGVLVYRVDPYFHYHKPDTEKYYYELNNQRSQNNGIMKYFDYDAVITGSSMTENFKASEFDEIFGVNSVKACFSGATFKEINDNLITAFDNNDNIGIVVRCLDMYAFVYDKDRVRTDLGEYPTYLFDSNPFNDVNYLFNKDVIFKYVYPMMAERRDPNFKPGFTPFDQYSRWQDNWIYNFGVNTVCADKLDTSRADTTKLLGDDEKEAIRENVTQNITSLVDQHPETEFYLFLPPYSIVWWNSLLADGSFYKQIEIEKFAIELLLEHDNIHLFSFNNRTDITTDLNNYKDLTHYGEWINSLMLKWMHEGKYQLTKDNYEEYIEKEREFYSSYDYNSILSQTDYENDYYAAALLNEELTGSSPLDLTENAVKDGNSVKLRIDDTKKHKYLVINGVRCAYLSDYCVTVYDDKNEKIIEKSGKTEKANNEPQQILVTLPETGYGSITVTFDISDTEYNIDSIILY